MSKLGRAAWAVGRITGRGMSNSRWLHAGYAAAKTTLGNLHRVGRLLWLQITGLFFIVFAVGFVARMPRAYGNYTTGQAPFGHFLLLLVLTILFAWFGVTSFWRARKR